MVSQYVHMCRKSYLLVNIRTLSVKQKCRSKFHRSIYTSPKKLEQGTPIEGEGLVQLTSSLI
jgi:hypothetical protein